MRWTVTCTTTPGPHRMAEPFNRQTLQIGKETGCGSLQYTGRYMSSGTMPGGPSCSLHGALGYGESTPDPALTQIGVELRSALRRAHIAEQALAAERMLHAQA